MGQSGFVYYVLASFIFTFLSICDVFRNTLCLPIYIFWICCLVNFSILNQDRIKRCGISRFLHYWNHKARSRFARSLWAFFLITRFLFLTALHFPWGCAFLLAILASQKLRPSLLLRLWPSPSLLPDLPRAVALELSSIYVVTLSSASASPWSGTF